MTSTAHALVAGAIARHFPDPVAAGTVALISHFILDSIPHWDFGTNWRNRPKERTAILAIGETAFGIGCSYVVYGTALPFDLWATAVVMSLLPDWLETPWYIWFARHKKFEPSKKATLTERIAYQFYKIPNRFHTKAQFPLGIVTQVATVAFFIVLLR